MSVLVIGGTGFIGPRVVRKLVERGEEVVCMDINPWAASFDDLGDRVKVVRGDITNFDDVVRTVLEFSPERLINLAYIVGGGEGDPHNQMRLNVLGMDNCFEAARLLRSEARGLRQFHCRLRAAASLRRQDGKRERSQARHQTVRNAQDIQ